MAEKLARQQIAVRAGLHCAPIAHASAGTDKTGTLRLCICVIGLSNAERKYGRCQISFMALDRAIRCGNSNSAAVYDDRGILFI